MIVPGAGQFAGVSVFPILMSGEPIIVTNTASGSELEINGDCVSRFRFDHATIPLDARVTMQARMKTDGNGYIYAEIQELAGGYVGDSEISTSDYTATDLIESDDFREQLIGMEQDFYLSVWLTGGASKGYIYSIILVIER